MMVVVRLFLLASALSLSYAILPEIVDSGISHFLEDNSALGNTALNRMYVDPQDEQQSPEDEQQSPEDELQHPEDSSSTAESASPQPDKSDSDAVTSSSEPSNLTLTDGYQTDSGLVTVNESVHTTEAAEQETNNISALTNGLGNDVEHACVTAEDCEKGKYCLSEKCFPCKELDVPCTKDEQCCGKQLCVWGQCSQNVTTGEEGSTCQLQSDCNPDLCCAFHSALLFSVCLAKPIERERCLGASNHLMELLAWDVQVDAPKKHCPCAGGLRCQHLGRGSMCLKREDGSEEDMTDSLYSEIDYII
ncbi:dickkopf-related protein 3a [Genypterus blacodes]|uniref:dickkopf-related protein 3a n=1 Tax=Genypterus blacodes TaxID=154954 RepID=UPI003F7593FC